ncbi:MAG: hypothetical protein D6732_04745 [Methanobacteriota archaeon]|nr:MAG: hypothetical protein D6732_04745 [Euryarchaeota archaeon]
MFFFVMQLHRHPSGQKYFLTHKQQNMKKLIIASFIFGFWCINNVNAQTDFSQVPEEAISNFRASFVYENGKFRGADVSPIAPYMSDNQILAIVQNIASQYATSDSDVKIFMDRKPKVRGCKPKKGWVCVIYGGTIIN